MIEYNFLFHLSNLSHSVMVDEVMWILNLLYFENLSGYRERKFIWIPKKDESRITFAHIFAIYFVIPFAIIRCSRISLIPGQMDDVLDRVRAVHMRGNIYRRLL